jgi:hypothetical protein
MIAMPRHKDTASTLTAQAKAHRWSEMSTVLRMGLLSKKKTSAIGRGFRALVNRLYLPRVIPEFLNLVIRENCRMQQVEHATNCVRDFADSVISLPVHPVHKCRDYWADRAETAERAESKESPVFMRI